MFNARLFLIAAVIASVPFSAQAQTTMGPIGQVDTPRQPMTDAAGAIGVTGWVIDDVGIASVKVYRGCLAAEPLANCQLGILPGVSVVFIGEASLVVGARPDVEAAFSAYPAANQAGFGLQVLTPMLPRSTGTYAPYGGQGPLTLYVIATDVEGHSKLLSRAFTDSVSTPTSITMVNDTIARPFGTIDSPGQGEIVSGVIANFGWALTPDGNTTVDSTDILIPADGSTSVVFIDGAVMGTVAYDQCRGTVGNPVPAGAFCDDDIANIFGTATPQAAFTRRTANVTRYRNLDAGRAAIGAFGIDTRALTNGQHTIAWSVTDSAGRTEGIGGRFFTVLNGSADPPYGAADLQVGGDRAGLKVRASVRIEGVWGRSGFDLTSPFAVVHSVNGVPTVEIDAMGRAELWLGPVDGGYLVANGTMRDLPVGSHLDAATGQFTWAPGPGYLGTYHLAFARGGEQIRIDVTIR